ncbi:MAG: hypothetical protein WCF26_15760 [Candidatus Sulfotelmatobacter sp.]
MLKQSLSQKKDAQARIAIFDLTEVRSIVTNFLTNNFLPTVRLSRGGDAGWIVGIFVG